MYLGDDENTCTLLLLEGFGGSYPNGPYEAGITVEEEGYNTLAKFKKECRRLVKQLNGYDSWSRCFGTYKVDELGAVYATTSSLQVNTEEFLKALGFTQNGPFKSKKYELAHSEMSLWTIPVTEFLEAIKE